MHFTTLDGIAITDVSHNASIKKQLIIPNGQIPHLTNFSRAVFPLGEVAHAHNHRDMTEVFFVESGLGEMVVNDKVIAMAPGACITIEPTEIHELRNTGETELVVLYFGIVD
ncbi:MAG: cupin [Oceanospirillaceae bacterium]|nr:cupin [Oceanospirillaceae bacterium]|tara:strand:- start:1558 stop:1893 length:336 start_codon:yes stop_codon:yes gene_type:complete